MMETKQEVFTEFMKEYVKLDVNQKEKELIEKQKTIMAHLFKYAVEHGIDYEFLRSGEITLDDDMSTSADYLEAMMVYMHNIEELIGTILSNMN